MVMQRSAFIMEIVPRLIGMGETREYDGTSLWDDAYSGKMCGLVNLPALS